MLEECLQVQLSTQKNYFIATGTCNSIQIAINKANQEKGLYATS